jgi:predicted TIM-barrel fold metal-dependent hydrolase
MKDIFDSHSHWMPPQIAERTSFFKVQWSDKGALLKSMDQAGVGRAVLLYPTSDAHLQMGGWKGVCETYNTEIAKFVGEYPQRLVGAGIIPVDSTHSITAELKRIKDLGLRAISLASSYNRKFLDDSLFTPVFEFCQKENFPVFIHSQIINPIGFERVDDPLLTPVVEYVFDITMCLGKMMMSGVLSKYRQVKFIFGHFGGVTPFIKDRFDSTYQMLRQRAIVKDLGGAPSTILKQVYVDTSGVVSPSMLNMALEVFGDKQILWGSDFPAKRDPVAAIKAIEELEISSRAKAAILKQNLAGIFSRNTTA